MAVSGDSNAQDSPVVLATPENSISASDVTTASVGDNAAPRRFFAWIQTHIFAPEWFPPAFRSPLFALLLGLLFQLLVSGLIGVLAHILSLSFVLEVLSLVAIALVALNAGAVPGLLATILSVLMLVLFQIVPASWDSGLAILLYTGSGVVMSLLIGRVERERRKVLSRTSALQTEVREARERTAYS